MGHEFITHPSEWDAKYVHTGCTCGWTMCRNSEGQPNGVERGSAATRRDRGNRLYDRWMKEHYLKLGTGGEMVDTASTSNGTTSREITDAKVFEFTDRVLQNGGVMEVKVYLTQLPEINLYICTKHTTGICEHVALITKGAGS